VHVFSLAPRPLLLVPGCLRLAVVSPLGLTMGRVSRQRKSPLSNPSAKIRFPLEVAVAVGVFVTVGVFAGVGIWVAVATLVGVGVGVCVASAGMVSKHR